MTDDGALVTKPTQVVDDRRLRSDLVVRRSDYGRCSLVTDAPCNVEASLRLDVIVPDGFVDLQVAGAGRVLFNEVTTVETWQTILRAHVIMGPAPFFRPPSLMRHKGLNRPLMP